MKKKFEFVITIQADNFSEACSLVVNNMIEVDNGFKLDLIDTHGGFLNAKDFGVVVRSIRNVSKPIITPTPEPVKRT